MLNSQETLPHPQFYKPEAATDPNYSPNQQSLFDAAVEWRKLHSIQPSAQDKQNIQLLLIDVQKDFCFPSGTLYVGGKSGRGALDDNRRTAEFIYANLHRLTGITASLDTHSAFQIFFAPFWIDAHGESLQPHRELTAQDIRLGKARPNPNIVDWINASAFSSTEDWLTEQVCFYCEELERAGRYKLYLWPPHCILGSAGHGLVGVIHEARMFHAYVRLVQSWTESKGQHPLTENYSIFSPEVTQTYNGKPFAQTNEQLIKTLLKADALIIAGQAASHCVMSSVDDLLGYIQHTEPQLARKVYLLEDCMSSVVIPDGKGGYLADFTNYTKQAFNRYRQAGMNIVQSTAPMADWLPKG